LHWSIFFVALLTLSATATATVLIVSNVSSPLRTSQMYVVTFNAGSSSVEPNGDPVGGGGGGPGCPN